jgi:hypothetical protein
MSRTKKPKTKIRRSASKSTRKTPSVLRPAVYAPELCAEIYGLMYEGLSLTAAAGKMRFSENHVRGWIETYPDFKDAVERGQAGRSLRFEREFIETESPVRAAICRFALPKVDPKHWGEYADVEPPPTYEEVKSQVLRDMYDRIAGNVLRPNPNAGLVDYVPGGDKRDVPENPEVEAASAAASDEQPETTTAARSETEPAPKAPSDKDGASSPTKKTHPPCTPNQGYHIENPEQYDDKSASQHFKKWKGRPSAAAI